MQKLKMNFIKISIVLILVLLQDVVMAQFFLDGQILQRGEYRHGFGRLIDESEEPAMFIGHRARLHASYKTENLTFFVSIQDVRTWGNTPQVKATDPYLSVHEAWAETKLGNYFTLKLGRQELSYDNFRFLGNLDWALQGRSHDFALLKFEKNKMKLDLGAGYNQDEQRLTGNLFTIPNQYKTVQFLRFENAFGSFNYSVMFWNNGMQYIVLDPVNNQITQKGIRYMKTIGIPTLKYQLSNTTSSGFYYHQLGRDVAGRKVGAFNANIQVSHLMNLNLEKGTSIRLTAGIETLSGTPDNFENRNHSFSPLYGTNHMHNGYMDMFYIGGRHENSVGLIDYFLRARYDFSQKLWTSLNAHSFNAFSDVYQDNQRISGNLGLELDLTLGYIINDAVSLQSGYSQFIASESFEILQGVQNAASRQNWAYIMMIYRPTMKNKFIGLLF